MSAAADNTTANPSSSAAAAFQIPGKKISVLPIGLGIFAGISVIALIVVGLVTYERTKYRKVRCTHGFPLVYITHSHEHYNRYSGSANWLSKAQGWVIAD
jgi:hypothetical protein